MATVPSDRCPRIFRLEMVAAGALLAESGVIAAGEGNLSVRIDSDSCLITPRGRDKARLDPAELVVLPLDGGCRLEQASSEARLHLAVYATLPEVAAVVHAHPPFVLRLAAAGRIPDSELLPEAEQRLPSTSRVPPLQPGSIRLAEAAADALCASPACVLERHGAVTVGRSLAEAMGRMLLLERLAIVTVSRTDS